ncbi:hypothetical protein FJ987_19045 [Mesorhizobium sp. CU2]|uniref:hypothetical protein n=1 Tax=unclassified Mesorhizobium TaxID=325217 RepID=UPI0011278322|nr:MULTISPECIES: hypothetical protein [unclassified Mesorhizobium]TPN83661.1 hypothetical protein FJ988_12795 [Mesorhizobium sp. CU3]TPO11185.1 hypothetical protein FJ987_19045 [Mesorhizobium sp. CU2]
MTRSLLAGACASAAILLALSGASAQTQAAPQPPAAADQPAPDQGMTDQGASSTSDAASADDDKQAPIAFEGGQLTITQPEQDGEKVLAYDGKQLASNYDVSFDKVVKIGDVNVALVDVGDGGNQCGPAKVIVWKKDGQIETTTVEQDECGAPPAAVADQAIYFVPFLLPGETKPALQWSPTDGLTTSGNLTYTPEPGTDWKDLDASKYSYIVDAFHNEAVYKAAKALLGDDMPDMATSLLVSGGDTEKTASGAFYATGCVPHDCGGNDGFMAIDPAKHKVYFARRGDNGPLTWPPVKDWPADIKKAYDDAQGN